MYLERHKRMKFCNEDDNGYFKFKVATLDADYGNKKEPSKVLDYSVMSTLPNLLEELDDGKYGSVTEEYETLNAQRIQVMNYLSALALSLASSCSSPVFKSSQAGSDTYSTPSIGQDKVNPLLNQHSSGSITQDIVDLDADSVTVAADPASNHGQQLCWTSVEEMHECNVQNISHSAGDCNSTMHSSLLDVTCDHSDVGSVNQVKKDASPIIVLDSDEEDGDHQAGTEFVSNSESAASFRAWLGPQILSRLSQAKILAREGHHNQLVSYDQGNAEVDGNIAVQSNWPPSIQYQKVVLRNVTIQQPIQDLVNQKCGVDKGDIREDEPLNHELVVVKESNERKPISIKKRVRRDSTRKPTHAPNVGIEEHSSSVGSHHQDDSETSKSDGLEDLWKDMSLAMECSKSIASDEPVIVQRREECEHSSLLRDDLGLVCRICGLIQKSIDSIFDFQWVKSTRTTRTCISGSRNFKYGDEAVPYFGPKIPEDDLDAAEISIHPRHLKQMKPHQFEGFNFLVRNLVSDKPGGCILAHAPGSGKTFMLISFIQSFLAKYPSYRPLVVLPKGILATWKREFQLWQVEDIPLFDFYSSKAVNRSEQLEVLKSWEEKKSILFLGYKQFANIVCDRASNKTAAACRERLLKVPGLLILDEGHTPRNEDTNVLQALAEVQTPRKVVLSGTLFQNHVKEVFNILNLVRPKFLKMESSRAVMKRVQSRVFISGGSKRLCRGNADTTFCDLVEDTLQNDDNFKRKVTVIQDLRELTKEVLHYYKGDFLDELPGLADFTVLLNLSAKQKDIVQNLGNFDKFKRNSVGCAVYIHPKLKDFSVNAAGEKSDAFNDEKIDSILDSMDVRDGVKAKIFLNILSMSESAGEKLLVFSQYLPPLKFLERLVVRMKGWRSGKEIFMISGDSSTEQREWSMEQFNNSPDAKVFFGSIKACGEGISLVGASRVLILDVHLNPSVSRQAIGRAFRPGQEKKVYVYRLVAADSPEEEDHKTSFRKELLSKMWFEWSEYSAHREFELDAVDIADCQDLFLESPLLGEDVKIMYRR